MLFPGTRREVTAWHVTTVPNPGPAASAPKGSEAMHRSYARWLDFPTLYSYPPSTLTGIAIGAGKSSHPARMSTS
jgi:hypothetical protein